MKHKINWSPSKKELFNFGLVILVGFGLIGTLLFFKGKHKLAFELWSGAGLIGLIALISPPLAKPFYWIWMILGLAMGFVMSRIVMTTIFYGIITPVALLFRIMRRDALNIKPQMKSQVSYWSDHPEIKDKTYYDHLF